MMNSSTEKPSSQPWPVPARASDTLPLVIAQASAALAAAASRSVATYLPNTSSMLDTSVNEPRPSLILNFPTDSPPPFPRIVTSAACPLSQVILPLPFALSYMAAHSWRSNVSVHFVDPAYATGATRHAASNTSETDPQVFFIGL